MNPKPTHFYDRNKLQNFQATTPTNQPPVPLLPIFFTNTQNPLMTMHYQIKKYYRQLNDTESGN